MPQKRKILHLITGLEVGGAEMMLLKTLPRLQQDFDNRVCCIRGRGPMAERLETAGVPVVFLDFNHPFDIGGILRFRAIIQEFQPNILVTYLIHADLFGRIFGRMFGIRKIVCNQRGKLLQWEFLRIIDWFTKFLVTKYIIQTETAQQELMKKLRLPRERFKVIPNAIDLKEFDFEIDTNKKRENIGLKPTDIVITCVSKLRRGKGHEYLFEAFESLSLHVDHDNPTFHIQAKNLKLLIVGDGERKEELLDQVRNYTSKSDILFLGNRDDVKEILKITDIFVLPTLGEGMSNAVMEAMAASLPVITTDIPENCELIRHDETGILAPPKNSCSLAKAIEQLLGNPKKREVLGENARHDICERFDIRVITLKLNQFFNGL